MPSRSAKRVAMWRIFTALVPARLPLNAGRLPEPQPAQHVPALLALAVEPLADGTRPYRPRQEDARRIVGKRLAQVRHGHTIRGFGPGAAHRVERFVNGTVSEAARVARHLRPP